MTLQRQSFLTIGLTIFIVWITVVATAAVWRAAEVFLLVFLGVLFAVFLTHLSREMSARLGIGYGWSLSVVMLTLLLISGGSLHFFGQEVERQIQDASGHLDEAADDVRTWIRKHPVVRSALSDLPFANRILGSDNATRSLGSRDSQAAPLSPAETPPISSNSRGAVPQPVGSEQEEGLSDSRIGQAMQLIADVFQMTLSVIMNLAVVAFVGIYLATEPAVYRDGFARLFPKDRRPRVVEILNRLGQTLWSWLIGRLASMLITGVGTGLALAVIGVPMALVLGGLTGVLTFIPNIGPALGLAFAVLVALPQGATIVVWVIVVFSLFQLVESYLLTPLIQQRQVSIPPALLIIWQVLLGVLTGFLGLIVATPILAVLLVLVKMIYLEDTPGERATDAA